jgi:hypothetical protein
MNLKDSAVAGKKVGDHRTLVGTGRDHDVAGFDGTGGRLGHEIGPTAVLAQGGDLHARSDRRLDEDGIGSQEVDDLAACRKAVRISVLELVSGEPD